jgi:hypothetical protein
VTGRDASDRSLYFFAHIARKGKEIGGSDTSVTNDIDSTDRKGGKRPLPKQIAGAPVGSAAAVAAADLLAPHAPFPRVISPESARNQRHFIEDPRES